MPVQYERSFRWKLSQFRYLCQSNALPNHIKLSVSRQTLFEDSFHQLMRLPAYELRRRLYIIFRGEEGLDYGGVARYVLKAAAGRHRPFLMMMKVLVIRTNTYPGPLWLFCDFLHILDDILTFDS